MSSSPLVSVVMSVYNGERHLREAIESILQQTCGDFEYIIINDGSTDTTPTLLAHYQQCDSRIQVYHQQNSGLTVALNRGLQQARGKYIARMDADDISLPERFAHQVAFLESHPEIGVCGTWAERFGDKHGEVWCYPVDDAAIRCAHIFSAVLVHPSVMLRREPWLARGLSFDPSYRYAQDYELWVRASDFFALANIPEILLRYRSCAEQIGRRHNEQQQQAAQRVRLSQIQRLGITPTAEELALHQRLSVWQFCATRSAVQQTVAWCEKLKAANDRTARYDQRIFDQVLVDRLFRACYAATGLGLWTWKMFWLSSLGRVAELSRKQKVYFAINCAIKRVKRQ